MMRGYWAVEQFRAIEETEGQELFVTRLEADCRYFNVDYRQLRDVIG
jgi:hypothetical protein